MISRRINPTIVAGLVVLAIATVVQESAISHASVDSVRPDVILLLTVNWTLLRGVEEGMFWGFTGGVFVDLFSGLPFGTSAAAYCVVAGFVTISERAFVRAHLLQPIATAFLATFVYYAVAFVIVASAAHTFFLNGTLIGIVVGVAIFNAAVNPFLSWGIHALDARMTPVMRTSL